MLSKTRISEKLALINEHWAPKIVGKVGDFQVKLAKFQGEFVWHSHPNEDEMFFVLEGEFTMRLRDGEVQLQKGEFLIVPAGVEHQPYAEREVSVMLFEPASTVNTGDAGGERTRIAEPL